MTLIALTLTLIALTPTLIALLGYSNNSLDSPNNSTLEVIKYQQLSIHHPTQIRISIHQDDPTLTRTLTLTLTRISIHQDDP